MEKLREGSIWYYSEQSNDKFICFISKDCSKSTLVKKIREITHSSDKWIRDRIMQSSNPSNIDLMNSKSPNNFIAFKENVSDHWKDVYPIEIIKIETI